MFGRPDWDLVPLLEAGLDVEHISQGGGPDVVICFLSQGTQDSSVDATHRAQT